MARGSLRIYLGAAPGVGKTFAMLNEGRRAHERGRDVVVAYVETHGRARTAEQVDGLEVVPRRSMTYRGAAFEELDVDRVLARHPEIALVDELAHTNVPGSHHAKRWQDVEQLLDAGITVISTVNIQHLESLHDVVEGITGINQAETVPDAVVRAADQIELVDMTPEALRRRMAHGNIYAAEQIDAALGNYFRPGNLTALRELALLWVADRVEESLQEYRERHGIRSPWETRERVVVALTGAPGGDALVRRAARIAGRTTADLVGVHVRGEDGLRGAGEGDLTEHRRLLEELGGTYREVVGADVAAALVHAARAENATQLVLGASHRSRWMELTRGSVVTAVVRQAGRAFDVHVISSGEQTGEHLLPPLRRRLSPLTRRRRAAALAVAVVGLPLLTLALEPFRHGLGFTSVALCYLLAVVLVATIGGMVPAGIAAVAGFGLLNWFFADPVRTFTISSSGDVIALVTFLVVAAVVSVLVDLAARRQADAGRARGEAEALAGMAGSLLREGDPLPLLLANVVELFDLEGASVVRAGEVVASVGVTAGVSFSLPLGNDGQLVIAGEDLAGTDRQILGAFADQLALALESRRLQAEAATAVALGQANELRSALLAAVSHDLRTPLTSIKTASSSLLSDVVFEADAERALLETIDAEADRLNDLVGNLLDMSRIQAGALVVKARPMGVEEVLGGALVGIAERGRPLRIDVPETIPRVLADPALLERVLANLVDNAVTWSPPGEPVRVEAGAVANRVDVRVVDRGPGIPANARDRVFLPFQRLGDSPNGMGVGLGLAVARGFVEAMGGELTIDDTPGGGTTMTVSLPAVDE
ncbi:MAG: putative two-component system sensor kinase for high-affinity potassium transport system [Actinomycetia bacterium]|nr:putative two-component system sensor kinase for high-affinity potassium transport system [Actinomycetes bacterium]